MSLSDLFGWLTSDNDGGNYGGTQRQSDGTDYDKGGDIVIRDSDGDSQAHTTWHFDTDGNVRCINVYNDEGDRTQRAEYDADGDKIDD
jgi:hypothetical protein